MTRPDHAASPSDTATDGAVHLSLDDLFSRFAFPGSPQLRKGKAVDREQRVAPYAAARMEGAVLNAVDMDSPIGSPNCVWNVCIQAHLADVLSELVRQQRHARRSQLRTLSNAVVKRLWL